MTEYPVTIADFLTLAGLAIFAALIVQWPIKPVIGLVLRHKDWAEEDKADARGLMIIGACVLLCLLVAMLGTFIQADWQPTVASLFEAGLMAFFAGMSAVGLYEVSKNTSRVVT